MFGEYSAPGLTPEPCEVGKQGLTKFVTLALNVTCESANTGHRNSNSTTFL